MLKFFKLAWYSFRSEFRAIREDITFDDLAEGEIERFIRVCDDRVNRAGIFLNEIAMVQFRFNRFIDHCGYFEW